MTSPSLFNVYLWGAITMGCMGISVFFLRFWHQTRDRLFALFSIAFAVLSLNWVALAVIQPGNETRHYAYLIRLAAFLLIIGAVLDKNRAGRE